MSRYLRHALLVASLCACQAGEQRDYTEPPVEVPDEWLAENEDSLAAAPLGEWWREFGDARLDTFIDEVIAANHDLAAAAARVDAAQAQARIAGAALYPSAGLNGSGTRQRQNFVGFPIPGAGSQVLSSQSNSFGVSLDLSWELDLWGKLDAREKAAVADYEASRAELRGAHLSLAAQAAKTWFAFAEARLQHELAENRVQSFEQTTRIMRDRYKDGRTAPLDLRLAESQLSSAKAVRELQAENLERISRQLEILTADYPAGELAPPEGLPDVVDPVPVGLPSELLTRRPDLVASMERLRAADLRLFEARKELWPSLSLTAGGGRRSSEVGDLLDSDFNVWSIGANLFQPLFQGGRLAAGIDLESARVKESLAGFAQAILQAFSEVEIALAVESSIDRRRTQLADAARHATAAESLAQARYLEGRHDILAVLTARRQSFDATSSLISTRRARLEARVDLHLALGGGFEDEREESIAPQDQP
jgi:outer membrane protein, multidrug efflux system